MATPITGPFYRTIQYPGPTTSLGFTPVRFYKWSSTYKQAKPFDRPLAYELRVNEVVHFFAEDRSRYADVSSAPSKDTGHISDTINKCYSKFVDAAKYHDSLWATNLLEAGSAMEMITGRLTQALRASRAIRRFDFLEAGRILRLPSGEMKKVQKRVSKRKSAKDFGANWLEFHFGWDPLMADIHEALETFVDPYPVYNTVRVSTGLSKKWSTTTASGPRSFTTVTNCSMSAELWVSNPNALLMNQMGFINPASIVWEAIPFSFVVDWFSNVGQVLSSYTDLVGLSMKNARTTSIQTLTRSETNDGWYNVWDPISKKYVYKYVLLSTAGFKSFYMDRAASITGPTLAIKPFKGFSAVRGLTAASLLVQFLGK